jgi:ribose transport system substrate-binding protein
MKRFRQAALLAAVATVALATGTSRPALAAGKEIAVIVKTTNSNYWQNVQKGANAAIGSVPDYQMTFQGPASESAVADEVNMVQNAVNRHVAGIVLAPSDPDALIPSVKAAWEAHIPVIIIDSPLGAGGEPYFQSLLTTDNRKAGELCAEALVAKAGQTGEVAVMSYVAGVGSEIGRVGGFTSYLKSHSKMSIVGPFYSQSQMATALNQTTDVLTSHPHLVGIFGANEPTAIGMARALKQAGRTHVVAVGFDGNQDLQNFVKDGTLLAIAVQGSYQMGKSGIETLVKVLQHQLVPKQVDTGVVLVTKENIDSPEAKNVLY